MDLGPVIDRACVELGAGMIVRNLRKFPAGDGLPDEDGDEDGGGSSGRDILVCARGKGLRGVFVHTREDGIHIGMATPASLADYRLMGYLCTRMRGITGNDGVFAGEFRHDMDRYVSPVGGIELFSEEWAMRCLMTDYAECLAMAMHGEFPLAYECFNYPFVMGPGIMSAFRLYPLRKPSARGAGAYGELMEYAAATQWRYDTLERTSSGRCVIRRFDDPVEREALENNDFTEEDARRLLAEICDGTNDSSLAFTMSAIPVGAAGEYRSEPVFIAYGDFLSFIDLETHEQLALVPFTLLRSLLDEVPGKFIDELQYVADKPLDDSQIAGMLSIAGRYTPPSPFVRLLYPGMGAPDGQRTFIFFWIPGVNGPDITSFRRAIPRMQMMTIRWNVGDSSGARMGDRFFMVCNSPHMPRGIVMSGILCSNPYIAAGGGWNVDLRPNFMMDTRHPSLVTTDLLADAVPGFDWTGASGGRSLSDDGALTLEELWAPQLDYAVGTFIDSGGMDKTLNAVSPAHCRF